MVESENQLAQTGLQRVDFVIVTALEEERDAVLDKLPNYRKLPSSKYDIRTYYEANLPVNYSDGSSSFYCILVMPLLGMGRVHAAIATSDVIRYCHPRHIILVGIAGGIAERGVNLGDILISDQIVDYELQKLTPDGPEMRWEVYRGESRLIGAAREFSRYSWQQLMKTARPTFGESKRHIGPIASGDKVIAFSDVLNKYRNSWPRLIGVEMEAAGVATAAFQSADLPGFFMVRAVSDLADDQKGSSDVKEWRQYACDAAASYAIALLKSGPVVPSEEENPRLASNIALEKNVQHETSTLNPFIYGRPVQPDEFINRNRELRTVFNRLRNSESTAIVGEPHIGKTSFLMQLADKRTQMLYLGDYYRNVLFSHFNFHFISNDFTPAVFWEKALRPLRDLQYQDSVASKLQQLDRTAYTSESLVEFFEFFDQQGKQLILLLDEFEVVLYHPKFQEFAFYATLRAVACSRSCSLILTSRSSLTELQEHVSKLPFSGGSPVFNFLMELRLRPFDDKSVDAILDQAGDILSSDERLIIKCAAGNYPYLTQAMAANLLEISDHTSRHLAIERFFDLTHSHFDDLWRTLSDRERTMVVILGLVECGKCKLGDKFDYSDVQTSANLGAGLHILRDLGLAERVVDGQQPYRKYLVWQGERWTLGTQALVCWVYQVVIARTHSLSAFDDWLKNRGYMTLLQPEQWERLLDSVRSTVWPRICDIGLMIEKRFE